MAPTATADTDAQRLVARLRMAADEIESAARYGVPIPHLVSVSGHQHGGMSFSATEAEFDAWADYTDAIVSQHHHDGSLWSSVEAVDVNGLPVQFHVRHGSEQVAR